ncbi:hypothetical protein VB774_04850 [Pseudanabaena galeata UHCC 0370]|jgi:hypothetical protein|uniref:Uncharacterized protein n=1 Tax=Pseudanabaena galeata UHCC 0370 TaxID=3110310 RepID=A0ABU5TFY7_9CYAN|nr:MULTISPECIES: hypothetical protein [Pseudanabaena]MEA5476943.1 hypothetical protein [Pseudanabaena galeata UHCC 0370]MEA5486590.1 hypothetical protein [Pseudanabaena sp. CCNP1317]WGS71425.1 hypothetical protein OA858_17155 [Pseudanabaena galeata CCNP1313]
MKKIILSILASSFCFTGTLPVFAGSFAIQAGSQASSSPILLNIPPKAQSNLLSLDISNAIAILLNSANTDADISNIVLLLNNGNGSSTDVQVAQNALSASFASLGINVGTGSPALALIEALTGLIPANFNGESGQAQTVDLQKLFLAIESFNQIVNELANIANGSDPVAAENALASLNALSTNQAFTTLSTTLASISQNLK